MTRKKTTFFANIFILFSYLIGISTVTFTAIMHIVEYALKKYIYIYIYYTCILLLKIQKIHKLNIQKFLYENSFIFNKYCSNILINLKKRE